MEDIKTGQFQTVYLLYGEESYLIRQYRNKLKDALTQPDDTMNTSFFEGKDIDEKELIDLAETMPFFAERRCIFIDDSGFFKKSTEALAAYIPDIPDTTCLVFTESQVDKRGKLFREVSRAGRAVEFKKQNEKTLMQWVLGRLNREGRKITRSVMELFLARTGTDMERIEQELEKLLCYTMGREVIEAEDVEQICVRPVSSRIFDMVDHIASRRKQQALDLYHDLLIGKEPPLRILSLVIRQFRILLQLKDLADKGFDYKYMAGRTGVPEFAVRKYIGQARRFTRQQLIEAVREGAKTDESIKSGIITDRIAVELYIIRFSSSPDEREQDF